MNTKTHLGIAASIQKFVQKELGIKLDTLGFMLGNIKPDIYRHSIKIPHFKDDAMDFIKNEINELLDYDIENSRKGLRDFSEKLGIVTHYISDFFCKVHSKERNINIAKHYLYEMLLSNYCQLNSRKYKNAKNIKYSFIKPDYNSICEYIDNLYNDYLSQKPSYRLDMTYALRACTSLCLSVISECVIEKVKTAA